MNRKRGFTLVELLVVIAIIALLIGLLLPALAKARQNAQSLKDKTQITQIHKAALTYASDKKGRLPKPGLINRLADPFLQNQPDVGTEDFAKNTTAHLFSAMISQNMFNPDLCIGTTEVNPNIIVMQDYNFNAFQPGQDVYWDGDSTTPGFQNNRFRGDPSTTIASGPIGGSNTSYAHSALCGQRGKSEWKDSQKAGFAVFGTRGTGGTPDPLVNTSPYANGGGAKSGINYERSPTLELHGPKKQWDGHVCFNDNHVETISSFWASLCVYFPANGSSPTKDNIYNPEFNDYPANGDQRASGDSWMGMFVGPVTQYAAEPRFDPLNP